MLISFLNLSYCKLFEVFNARINTPITLYHIQNLFNFLCKLLWISATPFANVPKKAVNTGFWKPCTGRLDVSKPYATWETRQLKYSLANWLQRFVWYFYSIKEYSGYSSRYLNLIMTIAIKLKNTWLAKNVSGCAAPVVGWL